MRLANVLCHPGLNHSRLDGRIPGQLWPISDEVIAPAFETAGALGSGRQRGGLDADLANLGLGMARDCFAAHAAIDNGVVVNRVVIHHRGVAVHIHHLRPWDDVPIRVGVAKTADRDKRVVMEAQSEIEADIDVASMEGQPDAGHPIGFRRERGPAAIAFRVPPAYPRRTPD
jgi:hypothetical protein